MHISNEAKVGILVFVGVVVFLLTYIFIKRINLQTSGYIIKVRFPNVENLVRGAPVKYGGGIKVGYVSGMHLYKNMVEVDAWISQKYSIFKGAKFQIVSAGILGEKYIQIFDMPSTGERFKSGDVVYGISGGSIESLLANVSIIVSKVSGFFSSGSGKEKLGEFAGSVSRLVDELAGLLSKNSYEIKRILRGLSGILGDLSVIVSNLKTSLPPLINSTKELIMIIKTKANTINVKDMRRLVSKLDRIVEKIDNLLDRLDKNTTFLGMLSDSRFTKDVRDIIKNIKVFTYKIKRDPSILIWRYPGR